jgi:hypothetical protein
MVTRHRAAEILVTPREPGWFTASELPHCGHSVAGDAMAAPRVSGIDLARGESVAGSYRRRGIQQVYWNVDRLFGDY